MEIQWPLLIFSVCLGVTSGAFVFLGVGELKGKFKDCLLYTSPSPRD